MNYREMIEAVEDAQLIVGRGDIAVRKLAELVVGRLRRSEVPKDQIWFASQAQLSEALRYSAQQIEQALKAKE